MAVSLLTSKILAAGAGALAGYLLYKPETKTGGNNSGQSKETKSNNSYVPTSSEVITATANIQRAENPYVFGRVIEGDVTDSRINSAFYFGDKNKPYDPFYDYTDFHLKTVIDSLAASNPLAILRARIIPEYTAVAKRWVVKPAENVLANGYCVDLRFRVEVFNPSAYPIAINKLGIQSISLNNSEMFIVSANWTSDIIKELQNPNSLTKPWFIFEEGKSYLADFYTDKYKNGHLYDYYYSDDFDANDAKMRAALSLAYKNMGSSSYVNFQTPLFEAEKKHGPYPLTTENWIDVVTALNNAYLSNIFTYDTYTPETVPAQGSFFQDYFFTDLYSYDSILHFKTSNVVPGIEFKAELPTAAQPNLLVGLKFANDDTSTEGVIYTSLYSGNQPPTVPVDYKYNYISENFGNIYAGLLDAKNAGIVDMWQTIREKYDADFDSSFGVDMAAYWYLWAVNKAALEDKIRSILGVDPNEFDSTTPARKLQMLKNEYYKNATSEQKQQLNELLTLWRNVFKSTELTISEAAKTYQEAYKNDVTKGVTLLPSLKYWAEQAAGAAPESIAPGTSSRSDNTNRNAVPDYRGTSAGTSTTTTTESTGSGLTRGGSGTSTSSGSGTSTRGVNGLAPGYQAASM